MSPIAGNLALALAFSLLALSSCGVKGPPLPPVAGDPAASEREDQERARLASPTPSPSPSPVAKKEKGR